MDNLGFIVAGYTLTWVTLSWYAWRTNRRISVASQALADWNETSGGSPESGTDDAPTA